MLKSLRILLIIILSGALVSSGFYFFKKRSHPEWVEVRQGPIVEAVYGLGTVTSRNIFHLKVGITTTVKQLFVREGDTVAANAPLVSFSDVPLVKAPFAGTVTELPLYLHETVYPQTAVLTLMDLNDRYVLVSLEQEAALRIRKGQAVRMSFESLRGETYAGTVESIYPSNDQFFVKIDVTHLAPEVLPLMTADVAITIGQKNAALQVPVRALSQGFVIKQVGNDKVKTKIKVGTVNGLWAEVLAGDLKAGDHVLLQQR